MGSPNFGTSNTPHIAVFCLWEDHYEYEEYCKKEGETPMDYNDWKEYERYNYLEMLKEDLESAFGEEIVMAYGDENVCSVSKDFHFGGQDFYIRVGIYLENGYNCGFKIDWKLDKCPDCYSSEVPSEKDAEWYFTEYNQGMMTILASKFVKRCQKEVDAITDKIDDVLMHLAPHCQGGGWCPGEYKHLYK